jgi:hypothetical protein
MSILRRFERQLDEKLRDLLSAPHEPGEGKELLEIHRGILDEVTARVQPVRRGQRAFPYNHLVVHIPVPDAERRALFAMSFADGAELTTDIREALVQAGCEPPEQMRAEVVLDEGDVPDAAGRGFHILYQRREREAAPQPSPGPPNGRLLVLTGKTARDSYAVGALRVNIGRLAEVLDEEQRLVRRNDVVFEETDDAVSATVSRAHAHIQYESTSGEFRLYDDHSAYGTSLFRGGALVHVPPGTGRGVAIRPGDEIYFGRARARFESGSGG